MRVNFRISKFKLFVRLVVLILVGSHSMLFAQITLPSIFNDNMVLQQNFEAPVWGWAEPGTELTVSGSWSRMPSKTITADED